MGARSVRCEDCAYLKGSPESRGEDGYQGDPESLEQMVRDGSPFACHQGISKPAKYVHPSGAEVPECIPGLLRPRTRLSTGCRMASAGRARLRTPAAGWTARCWCPRPCIYRTSEAGAHRDCAR